MVLLPPALSVSVPACTSTVPLLLKATPVVATEKLVFPTPCLANVPVLLKALTPPSP